MREIFWPYIGQNKIKLNCKIRLKENYKKKLKTNLKLYKINQILKSYRMLLRNQMLQCQVIKNDF